MPVRCKGNFRLPACLAHVHASAVAPTACCTTSAPPQSQHTTRSGRTIQLRVWAAREEIDARRADWALACLQAAMR